MSTRQAMPVRHRISSHEWATVSGCHARHRGSKHPAPRVVVQRSTPVAQHEHIPAASRLDKVLNLHAMSRRVALEAVGELGGGRGTICSVDAPGRVDKE